MIFRSFPMAWTVLKRHMPVEKMLYHIGALKDLPDTHFHFSSTWMWGKLYAETIRKVQETFFFPSIVAAKFSQRISDVHMYGTESLAYHILLDHLSNVYEAPEKDICILCQPYKLDINPITWSIQEAVHGCIVHAILVPKQYMLFCRSQQDWLKVQSCIRALNEFGSCDWNNDIRLVDGLYDHTVDSVKDACIAVTVR